MDLVIITFDLMKWSCVISEFTLEIAFVNTATTAADVAQMTGAAGGEIVDRGLKVKLMTLVHKWFYRHAVNITVTIDFGDTITVIYLAIGTYRDATKATVALNKIWGMSLHEVVILGIGGNDALYLLNLLEE